MQRARGRDERLEHIVCALRAATVKSPSLNVRLYECRWIDVLFVIAANCPRPPILSASSFSTSPLSTSPLSTPRALPPLLFSFYSFRYRRRPRVFLCHPLRGRLPAVLKCHVAGSLPRTRLNLRWTSPRFFEIGTVSEILLARCQVKIEKKKSIEIDTILYVCVCVARYTSKNVSRFSPDLYICLR